MLCYVIMLLCFVIMLLCNVCVKETMQAVVSEYVAIILVNNPCIKCFGPRIDTSIIINYYNQFLSRGRALSVLPQSRGLKGHRSPSPLRI